MARTYRQLDLDQRRTLLRLVEARRPMGEIAERLDRHPSTIYREPGRDRFRDGDRAFRGYFPLTAQDLADRRRRRRRRRRKLTADDTLDEAAAAMLASGRAARRSPDREGVRTITVRAGRPHPAEGVD
jgi:IS30 family transposase